MTSAPFAPGFRIGDYELLHELGRGAIGETFAARAVAGPRKGQRVCLKVLAQEFRGRRSAERDAAERHLQHEARVVSQLEHPNIARLLDSGAAGDVWYLAFELVEGANLADVLVDGPLGAYHVMHIGLELSKALACAHERDVLHRDIKPNNILISAAGEVKLVDFGLAKLNAGAASRFSQHVGTPRYFSPEQLRGGALTPATDIYSVGLVLFELLTGSHPFYSVDVDVFRENVLSGLTQHSLRGRGLPQDLIAIVESCIELDSGKRFSDGAALHRALREAIDHCSRASDVDLRELALVAENDAEPDSQAMTRLGDLADRVADIRDEPGDLKTRISADPADGYRRAVREIELADTVHPDLQTMPFEAKSIMDDLSRLARTVSEQRSSGIEHAEAHRSGLRAAHATPLLRRNPARTAASDTSDDGAAPVAKREPQPVTKAAPHGWTRRALIAALCLLLAAAAVALMRPSSQPRVPAAASAAAPSRAATVTSSTSPMPATQAAAPPPPSAAEVARQPAPPTTENAAGSAPPSSNAKANPSTEAPPHKKDAKRHTEPGALVSVTIGTIPYGEVTVDGRPVGLAPVVVQLPPGRHRIVARAQQLRRTETIVVSPETNRIVLDLRNDIASP
jgi:serine/threonine protein kinase